MIKEASEKVAALAEILKKAAKMEPEAKEAKDMEPMEEEKEMAEEEMADEEPDLCPHCGQPMAGGPKGRAMLMIIAKSKKPKKQSKSEE